jgi:hypothetical protein
MSDRRSLVRREHATHMVAAIVVITVLAGCALPVRPRPAGAPLETISLPLIQGWFDGRRAYYVTTDISDAGMAGMMGANHVPRLANALPPEPKVPGTPSSTDRIYVFPNGEQANVLPSAPEPLGPGNKSNAYSPLWQLVNVTWNPGFSAGLLRSEQDVLEAEDAGRVTVEPTRIVVNCPVVRIEDDLLRGASLPKKR